MYILTEPTAEPVTVAEAKAALRIDDTRYDNVLPGLISSARSIAEQETGRKLMAQTWRVELAYWPTASDIFHLYRPTAVVIDYWDGADWQTLAIDQYVFWANCNGTSIAPELTITWPTLGDIAAGSRVRIDITAGATDAADVQEHIKTYIKAVVGQIIQTPELSANATVEAHPLLARILDQSRLWS